jgi:hypothetical protein
METVGQSGVWMGNASCRTNARVFIFRWGDMILHSKLEPVPGSCTDYQADYQVEWFQSKSSVRSEDSETRSRSPVKSWDTEFVAHLTELVRLAHEWGSLCRHTRGHPSYSKSTMLSILARSSQRRLPPPTLLLRSFSSSVPTWQAVPTETGPLNKEFKIYRWVLSSLLLSTTCLHSPLTVILL